MRLVSLFFVVFLTTCALAQTPSISNDEPVMIEVTDFNENAVKTYVAKIKLLKSKGYTNLWVRIDSFGGSVFDGMNLVRELEQFGHPITCVADIKAMSMGFYLLQYCDVRLSTQRTVLMAHGPRSGAQGTDKQLASESKFLEVIKEIFADQVALRTHLTKKEFLTIIDEGDYFFGAEEALEIGAIDKIITPKEMPHLYSKASESLSDLIPGL
jgi:ATP-dependent protease ClpP protease subunit